MINLKNLSKTYRTTEIETTALRGMNVEIRKGLRAGEHVALPEPQAASGEGD